MKIVWISGLFFFFKCVMVLGLMALFIAIHHDAIAPHLSNRPLISAANVGALVYAFAWNIKVNDIEGTTD